MLVIRCQPLPVSGNNRVAGVPEPMECVAVSKFSDRLARAKADLGVSTRAAADRAKAQGYRLSANSVSLYTRDGHPDPDGKTVEALAYALRVPEAELRELAGLPQHHGKFEPAPEADTLTRQQRDAVNEVIRLFAAGNQGAGDGSERSATPMNQAGGKPAISEDDGLGSFGGRARGDLDHESVNDGADDNVHELFTPPPPASETAAWETENRGRKTRKQQDDDAEASQDPEDDEE